MSSYALECAAPSGESPAQTDIPYLYINAIYRTAAQRNPNPWVVIQMISFQDVFPRLLNSWNTAWRGWDAHVYSNWLQEPQTHASIVVMGCNSCCCQTIWNTRNIYDKATRNATYSTVHTACSYKAPRATAVCRELSCSIKRPERFSFMCIC